MSTSWLYRIAVSAPKSLRLVTSPALQIKRNFFAYFRVAFNSVDADRLKEVGPDRLCAEWLLKNGGSVKFAGQALVSDYNSLGTVNHSRRSVEEVQATDASIMAIGFEHFKGCKEVKRIELTRCKHLENEAMKKLTLVGDSLTELTVSDCFNICDSGLEALGELKNLHKLEVNGVPYVENLEKVKSFLQAKLPDCEINITK